MQQEIVIATISIVILTLITPPLLTSNAYAHGGVWGKTVILYDNPEGHSKGWNPNAIPGTQQGEHVFRIFDPDFNPYRSTVLINLRSSGPAGNAGCHADTDFYPSPAGIFYVNCDQIVNEGAELHYTLFNQIILDPAGGLSDTADPDPFVSEQALKLTENLTHGIEGGLALEQQRQLANVTGADGR